MPKFKNIVVIYWSDDWRKKQPLAKAESTRRSFEDWHDRGQKQRINMYRASLQWYDLVKNVFKKAWVYRNGRWKKINKPVKPDLIFDKVKGCRDYSLYDLKTQMGKRVKIFNNPLLRVIIDNKLAQYVLFSEFMPQSFLANNRKELAAGLRKINSEKVVVKPLFGSGGFGIKIKSKKDAVRAKFSFPVLAQKFILSEKGIPGFSAGRETADLRLVYMNHVLVYALSRIAKRGSLFTNFHQGASAVLVPRAKIPVAASKIAGRITRKLKIFSEANYCLDFIFDNRDRPYLVEINSTPGFDLLHLVGDEKDKAEYFKKFVNILKK